MKETRNSFCTFNAPERFLNKLNMTLNEPMRIMGDMSANDTGKKFLLTENIKDLDYCLTSVDITIAIRQMTLQLTLLYELINHVTNCYYDVRRR